MYMGSEVGRGSLVGLVCVEEMAMGHAWELAIRRFVVLLGCCLGFLGLSFLVWVQLLGLGFVEILWVLVCSFIVAALARGFLSRRVLVCLFFRQVAMKVVVVIQDLSLVPLVGALGWLCGVVRFLAVRLLLVFLGVRIGHR